MLVFLLKDSTTCPFASDPLVKPDWIIRIDAEYISMYCPD